MALPGLMFASRVLRGEPGDEECVHRLSVDSLFLYKLLVERRDWALDRGWILDDDDVVNIAVPINMRILNDIAKTYHHQASQTSIEIRHKNEQVKDLRLLVEEIHSLERIYNVTFNFTPDLR